MPAAIDPTLLRIFETELAESLQVIEANLLRIEQEDPEREALLEDILRLAHDLKGSSRVVGLEQMGHLSHAMETFVMPWRDEHSTAAEAVGLVLRTCDLLSELTAVPGDEAIESRAQELIEDLENGATGPAPAAPVPVEQLEPESPQSPPVAPTPAAPTPADEPALGATGQAPSDSSLPAGSPNGSVEAGEQATTERRATTDRRDGLDDRRGLDRRDTPPRTGDPRGADTLRVPRANIDGVVDGAAEILADAFSAEAQLKGLRGAMRRLATVTLPDDADGEIVRVRNELRGAVYQLNPILRLLEKRARDLVDRSQSLSLVPVAPLVVHLERVARDTARALGRELRTRVDGREALLDVMLLEALKGPLTHVLRNAVDHGIEPPEERVACGKSPQGSITLGIAVRGDRVCVTVEDDGRGIDTAAVRGKLGAQAAGLDDEQLCRALLTAGISTRDEVTEFSGRGIGMGALAATIERMRGDVRVESQAGAGTRIEFELPLRLSVVDGLLVRVGDVGMILPKSGLGSIGPDDGSARPLAEVLGWSSSGTSRHGEPRQVVRLSDREGDVAVAVDAIGDFIEVVRRPMGNHLGRVPRVDGVAILPQGDPALILDLREVAAAARGTTETLQRSAPAVHRVLLVDDSPTLRAQLHGVLTEAGFDVVLAEDGRAGVERFEETVCDAVVTDVQMPRLDGFGVLQLLADRAPVVLVTSFPQEEGRARAMSAGALAYLPKDPHVGERVVETLTNHLSLHPGKPS